MKKNFIDLVTAGSAIKQLVSNVEGTDYDFSFIPVDVKLSHRMEHFQMFVIYKKDDYDKVVNEINEKMGAFVAVEDKYQGLIPKQELHKRVNVGDTMKLRVSEVREDGKLNLSISQLAYQQMEEDSEMVYQAIMSFDGVLPFNDKASPQLIERELGLSKAAFKRAVGRLLKEGRIEIHEHSIVTK